MDHQNLLDEIRKHFDEKTEIMRTDLRDLDNKLDGYQERLIRVESNLGFIRASLTIAGSIISGIFTYIGYKYLDLLGPK